MYVYCTYIHGLFKYIQLNKPSMMVLISGTCWNHEFGCTFHQESSRTATLLQEQRFCDLPDCFPRFILHIPVTNNYIFREIGGRKYQLSIV